VVVIVAKCARKKMRDSFQSHQSTPMILHESLHEGTVGVISAEHTEGAIFRVAFGTFSTIGGNTFLWDLCPGLPPSGSPKCALP
jgi:hypothetical protein